MTEQLILSKLDSQAKQFETLNKKVDKIEVAVGLIAVQSERINNVQIQTQALWQKYDETFGPDGIVTKMKQFQAQCPKEYMQESLNRQWKVIGLLATIVTGCLLKSLGVI